MRLLLARPRLFICLGIGAAAWLVLPRDWRETTRLLVAWNVGTWLYLLLVGLMVLRTTHEDVRRRALLQDENRFVILGLAVAAALASIAAIVAQLGAVKTMDGAGKALHVGLASATIVSAWAFLHLMFALHYAHEYTLQWNAQPEKPSDTRGGLNFPDTDTPDYGDFLYFSYVIGVASQTADVSITSPSMRRLALVHGVVSFFFNTTLLALTINIAAGLI